MEAKEGSNRQAIPLYRDPRIRAIFFQIVAIGVFVAAIVYIGYNTKQNLEARNISIGLEWLQQVVPFGIGFSPFISHKLGETVYWEVFAIAIQNTIYVSVFGIIASTFLGFLVGVMRLSPNWLVAKIATVYVEMFRNIPLLLWFFFWYVAVFLPILPDLRNSLSLGDSIFLNKEGFYFPAPVRSDAGVAAVFWLFVAAALGGVWYLVRWARARQARTGEQFPVATVSVLLLVLLPIAGFFVAGSPYHFEYPELGRFQLKGGINMSTSFFVCWFSLTTYTAAFIAENVRGGILAVPHGQTEASHALGLRHSMTLNLVVTPQAMRVIIPPTISQYLNLTKNSTLAVAVAYEEIASLWMGIALNQTGQALVIIAMSIFVFYVLSFSTSAVLNWYNKKVQITER